MNLDYQPRLWTLEEKSILRTYYNHITNIELQAKLYEIKSDYPRTISSITNMANKLNLSKKINQSKWSVLELDYLKNHYSIKTYQELAKDLNRSVFSVANAFNRYFPELVKFRNKDVFTYDEIQFLKDNKEKSISSLANYLSRDKNTIVYQLKKLNIHTPSKYIRFTENEIQFLKDNQNKSCVYLAKKLNRDKKTILNKLRSLGIIKVKKPRLNKIQWNDKDVRIVKDLYKTKTYQEIADILKRDKSEVTYLIRKLNFKNKARWTKEDDLLLIELYKKVPHKYISKMIDKSISAISKRARFLNLIKDKK